MSLLHRLSAKLDAALHRFEKLDLGYTYDEMYPSAPCGSSGSDKKTQYPSLYVNRTKGDVMDIPETGKAVVEYVLTGRNMSKRDGKTTYGMDLQIKSFDPQGTKKADAKMKKDGLAVAMSSHAFARGDQVAKLLKKTGAVAGGFVDIAKMRKATHPGKHWPAINDGPDLVLAKRLRKAVAGGVREIRAAAKKGYKFSEFSDRTRNGDGQFVGNVTGGADPVTMRQAYGEKPKRSLLAPGVGAAALAGAGLLGTKSGRVMTAKAAKGAARMVRSTVDGIDRKVSGKTGAMWPRMGSKAKPKPQRREGLGEVIYRQGAKSKTAPKWPRGGD